MANFKSRKVAIVGAGAVGSGFAFALAQSGIAEEIALVDVNADLAKGQALDLAHGAPFYRPVNIHAAVAPEWPARTTKTMPASAAPTASAPLSAPRTPR